MTTARMKARPHALEHSHQWLDSVAEEAGEADSSSATQGSAEFARGATLLKLLKLLLEGERLTLLLLLLLLFLLLLIFVFSP
jgi:hypothetical protein